MAIPKFVLIDDDIRYVFLLQAKIAERFLDAINLEVITEESFFQEYFSVPREIDLLIIDEKYFGQVLNRHDIKKVIVLNHDDTVNYHDTGNIINIYKYSNIRDIFNVISSRDVGIKDVKQIRGETQVVLVTSAAGGSGKTCIALGLSGALENDYKKTLYVDAESFQTFPLLIDKPCYLDGNDLIQIFDRETMCAFLKQHIISGELSYLPAFKTPIVSVGLSFELYRWFIETIKKQGDYDYIVVDSDSAFNQEKVDLISCADKVIFVTDQSDKGINSTNQILKHLSEVNDGKYMFVCNKFHSVPGGITKYEMSSENYKISEYIEACSDGKIGFGTLSSLSGIRRLSFLLQ